LFHENGFGTIEKCEISGNALAGLKIRSGDHSISVKKCEIHDGGGSGILILDNGLGETTIEQSQIFCNANAGIEIRRGGDPVIRNCDIYEGKGWGILCCEDGKGRVEGCKIYDNAYVGVEIKKGELNLKDCWVTHNSYYGISVSDIAIGTLENCHYAANVYGMCPFRARRYIRLVGNKPGLADRLFHYVYLLRPGR